MALGCDSGCIRRTFLESRIWCSGNRKTVVFVNGCFWHRHANCRMCSTPKSRTEFWNAKFEANVARDNRNYELLALAGWNVVVVWECETRDQDRLDRILRSNLLDHRSAGGFEVTSVQEALDRGT